MTGRDDDARQRVADRIAAVKARFVAGLDARAGELSELARQAAAPDSGKAASARDALRMGLHNLAGAAPTLGLHELGRKAAELEAEIMSAPAGRLDDELAAGLARKVAALAKTEA